MKTACLKRQIGIDSQRMMRDALGRWTFRRIQRDLESATAGVPQLIAEDLLAISQRDAAAAGSPRYVYGSYAAFRAVFAYRVAHSMLAVTKAELRQHLIPAARLISERTKVQTGVEIHPAASIGRRFVIDHGLGTVIGEQTEIGDDCYVLQAVVFGGTSVGMSSAAGTGRRHPRVGHRVQVAAGVMVLGPVTVGDDCRLEAGARITTDIPPRSCVKMISTLQICRAAETAEIHGIADIDGEIVITGAGLSGMTAAVLGEDYQPLHELMVTRSDCHQIRFVKPVGLDSRARMLALLNPAGTSCYVSGSSILRGLRTPVPLLTTAR